MRYCTPDIMALTVQLQINPTSNYVSRDVQLPAISMLTRQLHNYVRTGQPSLVILTPVAPCVITQKWVYDSHTWKMQLGRLNFHQAMD